jgi:hypothetical protein
MKKIGGLWFRESKDGKSYASGKVLVGDAEVEILVFNNDKKTKETQPDKLIYLAEPRSNKAMEQTPKVVEQKYKRW